MNQRLDRLFLLVERFAACAALAAGGAVIVAFAHKLVFGPLLPQVVGVLISGIAGGLACYVGLDFTNSIPIRSKLHGFLLALLGMVLVLAGMYFVEAASYAAKASLAP
jgi:hypothetical protein